MFNDCIIMAGGSGTRLWPASSTRTPKQFLSISGQGSFFDASLERALALFDREGNGRVIIIAGRTHVPHIVKAAERLKPEDRERLTLLPEPAARNTAPAILCGAVYADRVFGEDRNIMVLTSDHIIEPLDVFTTDAAAAAAFSRQGNLTIFGIPPAGPETGYGYIEAGETLPIPGGAGNAAGQGGSPKVFRVASFREKPDRKTAEEYAASGRFYWNSGMFAFSSRFILEEFRRSAPDMIRPFEALSAPGAASYRTEEGLRILEEWPGLRSAYESVQPISVDYAIAEKCRRTVMVAAGFQWYDVGSWDEYAKLAREVPGGTFLSGAENCFVDSDIPVALCGVRDLIVAVRSGRDGSPPAVLIARRGETQRVRDIVEQIKTAGKTELL
jgi:mannose-1-phosphate guanylyltransferase/mannose-6-phosphate isomerase